MTPAGGRPIVATVEGHRIGAARLAAGFVAVAAAALLVAAVLGMFRGSLLSDAIRGKTWPWAPSYPPRPITAPALSDPVWQFVPWVELARRELAEGRLPLWNPHQSAGVPLLGNAQSALGSPLLWPALLLGIWPGWNLSLLLRLLVAGTGTWAWLRERGRSRPAALLGAAGFALSGPFVAWLEHPHTLAAAPVPWLLLFAARLAERPGAGSFAGVALATACVLAGGHPETALMAAVLTGGVVVARVPAPSRVLAPVGAALVGAGLAGPLLLPFFEYFWRSGSRLGADRQALVLPLRDLARFLTPELSGSHPIEAAASVSLPLLVLSLAGLLALGARRAAGLAGVSRPGRGPDRDAIALVAFAVVALLVTYDGPLARALATATPACWTRALLLLPLPLATLGSGALDALVERARRAGHASAAAALGLAVAAGGAAELLSGARGVHGVTPEADRTFVTPIVARLLADPGVFRVLPLHTFLPANTASVVGLDDLRGYDALEPREFRKRREAIGRFRGVPTHTDVVLPWDLAPGGAALDAWNVKYLLLHPQFAFGAETLGSRLGLDLEEVSSGPDGRLLRNRRVRPRARLLDGTDGTVAIVSRTATRWLLDTQAKAAATLELANAGFPGWVARLDGRPVPLEGEEGGFLRVAVPAGRHRVEIAYRPASFWTGCAVAAVSALALSLGVRRYRR